MLPEIKTFGERLQFARKKAKISQKELADRLGYKTPASISNIESNRSPMDSNALRLLPDVVNIDLHWLITGQPSPGDEDLKLKYYDLLVVVMKQTAKSMVDLKRYRDNISRELFRAEERIAKGLPADDEDPHYDEFLRNELKSTDENIRMHIGDDVWLKSLWKSVQQPQNETENSNS